MPFPLNLGVGESPQSTQREFPCAPKLRQQAASPGTAGATRRMRCCSFPACGVVAATWGTVSWRWGYIGALIVLGAGNALRRQAVLGLIRPPGSHRALGALPVRLASGSRCFGRTSTGRNRGGAVGGAARTSPRWRSSALRSASDWSRGWQGPAHPRAGFPQCSPQAHATLSNRSASAPRPC
jgi:hypothetical protein